MPIAVGGTPPPIPLVPATDWKFAVGPWNSLPDTELSRISSRSVTWRLTGLHEASFTIDGLFPEAENLHELITDLWVLRNGTVLYRGRVGASSDTADAQSLTSSFSTASYGTLLARRIIFDGDTLVYAAQDKAAIAWALIVQTQAKPGGNLGLARGIGTASATTSSSTYAAGTTVADMVGQLAGTVGFDWDLTPAGGTVTQTFDAWSQRGTDRRKVVDYPGAISAFTRSADPGVFANVQRSTGATGLAALTVTAAGVATDPAGRFESQSGDPNIMTTSALAAVAAKQLADSQLIVPSWTVTLAPDSWGGPDDVWLGDPVTLAVKFGRLNVVASLRVTEIHLTLDDASDTETVTLTLGTPPPGNRWLLRHLDRRLQSLERR